jgi:hypothetical protein
MAFGFTRTLPTVAGSHVDMPILLTAGSFPATAIDGGGSSFTNGGGNLRAYTDDTKAVRLSLDVVEFIAGATPEIQVWVKLPIAATGNTIYLEADAGTSQPAFTAAFGRNSVWTNYTFVCHMESLSTADSSGNVVSAFVYNNVTEGRDSEGRLGLVFSGNGSIDCGSAFLPSELGHTMATRFQPTTLSGYQGIVGNWINGHTGRAYIGLNSANWNWDTYSGAGQTTPHRGVNLVGSLVIRQTGLDNLEGVMITEGAVSKAGVGSAFTPPDNDENTFIGGLTGGTNNFCSGVINEIRFSEVVFADDYLATDFTNQAAPDTWGTSSAWVNSGGGGVTITGATANYNYSGISASIDLTGEVFVIGGTANYDYEGITVSVELGAEVIVTGQAANYNYEAIGGSVELTGLISVTGQTANYNYNGLAADIIIQGSITVTGSTANYNYNTLNATIILQGAITINPKNTIRVKRNLNTIRAKRNSNTIRVR